MSAEFDAFVANMPQALPSFIENDLPDAVTVEDGTEHEFTKNLSPQSLPYIEAFVLSKFETPEQAAEPDNQAFSEGVMRYVGEVFLRALGGTWDFDEDGDAGDAMPFIRPDSAAGEDAGEPISLIGLLMHAIEVRTGEVFVSRFVQALEDFGNEEPHRSCTGLEGTVSTEFDPQAEASTEGEREFLTAFLPTLENAIKAWIQDQAGGGWDFDRESLARVAKQISARYDTLEELAEDRENFYLAGALRFIGETMRRAARGLWRYGDPASGVFDVDDPRRGQPYLQFGDEGVDVVPWMLIAGSVEDEEILPLAYDALISGGVGEAVAEADAAETASDGDAAGGSEAGNEAP